MKARRRRVARARKARTAFLKRVCRTSRTSRISEKDAKKDEFCITDHAESSPGCFTGPSLCVADDEVARGFRTLQLLDTLVLPVPQRRVALMFSSVMLQHETLNHPERCGLKAVEDTDMSYRPERITIAFSELCRSDLIRQCVILPIRRANPHELKLCHDALYISGTLALRNTNTRTNMPLVKEARQYNKSAVNAEVERRQDSVYLNEASIDCALVAAGCIIDALDAVVTNKVDCAAALVRPPGHHAENHRMMGFCIYNSVAVGVAHALKRGYKRIMVVDWDVHHGNGTQRCFEDDSRVLFVSLHRYDNGNFYPTGRSGGPHSVGFGNGAGYTINIGWNGAGAGDVEYAAAFEHVVLPVAKEFAPQLILISAGFDSALGDPLGGCKLTPKGYAWLTSHLTYIQPKVLLCLEGGYNCLSLAKSFVACIASLIGDPVPRGHNIALPSQAGSAAIAETARALKPHWPKQRGAFETIIKASLCTGDLPVRSADPPGCKTELGDPLLSISERS